MERQSAPCEAGPSGHSALKGVGVEGSEEEAAYGDRAVGKAKQAIAAAARGVKAADYTTLQTVSAALLHLRHPLLLSHPITQKLLQA